MLAGSPYRGAYGLRLPQFTGSDLLAESPSNWTAWTLHSSAEIASGPWQWADNHAVLPVQPGGRAVIDRESATTTLHGVPTPEAAWLHPYLASTALACAAWRGQLGLHAGVIVLGGRAWGLLGDRGAGKSSTLMWWLRNAGGVLADDLLVTDGRIALAGPRFLDLRAGAAAHFGAGTDVGVLGLRRRWRVPTGPVEAEIPLAGLVDLAWGSTAEITPVPLPDRFELIAHHRGMRFPVSDDISALHALTLPMLRFVRPKAWDAVETSMALLRSTLGSVD